MTALSIVSSNSKSVRGTERDREYDRTLKEINLIDNWSNYAANNGLFNGKHKDEQNEDSEGERAYKHIHEELKKAQDTLNDEKFSESKVYLASARMTYLKVLYSKSWSWRFVNMYAGPVWIYLTSFLIMVLAFYIYSIDDLITKAGVEQAAVNSVTWGSVGGILRGMWYLKDKVSERQYKNSWWIFFISVPFLGGIFGAIVYLIIIAGILSLGVGNTSTGGLPDITRPAVIIPIAALAGFNWEWAITVFKRIGDLITPSDQTK